MVGLGARWRPGVVRCCGGGFHPGDGMSERLLIGALLRGLWGRQIGHLVSRLLSSLGCCSPGLIVAKMSWRIGEPGGGGRGALQVGW